MNEKELWEYSIKVDTREEVQTVFECLDYAGYRWKSGHKMLEWSDLSRFIGAVIEPNKGGGVAYGRTSSPGRQVITAEELVKLCNDNMGKNFDELFGE